MTTREAIEFEIEHTAAAIARRRATLEAITDPAERAVLQPLISRCEMSNIALGYALNKLRDYTEFPLTRTLAEQEMRLAEARAARGVLWPDVAAEDANNLDAVVNIERERLAGMRMLADALGYKQDEK